MKLVKCNASRQYNFLDTTLTGAVHSFRIFIVSLNAHVLHVVMQFSKWMWTLQTNVSVFTHTILDLAMFDSATPRDTLMAVILDF